MSRLTPILILLCVLVFIGLVIYRRLINLRNKYTERFSQIDVLLKQRYDLIPKLVEAVKAYIQSEDDTLQAISEARNAASSMREKVAKNPTDAQIMKRLVGAENALTDHLFSISLVIERNSELKSNPVLQKILEESKNTEIKISGARKEFNDAVTLFNQTREKLPNSIISTLFEFQNGSLFQINPPREREVS